MHKRLFCRLIFRSTRLRSSVETSLQLGNYTKSMSDIIDTNIMVYKYINVNNKRVILRPKKQKNSHVFLY